MPTDLERAVIDTIARLNRPQTRDDVPYPASLLPIAQAVIEVVRSAERDEVEARAHDAEADYDRRGERLWRLAALAGHVPCESDNDATAELAVRDALAERAEVRARVEVVLNDPRALMSPFSRDLIRAALDGEVL